MKKITLIIMLLILTSCSAKEDIGYEKASESYFEVRISTEKYTYHVGEKIEVMTELINKSNHAYEIEHRSPLVSVQAFDEHHNVVYPVTMLNGKKVSIVVYDDIGNSYLLQPNGIYDPNANSAYNQNRIVELNEPGVYQLIGTAWFSIASKNEVDQEFKLKSEPFQIEIIK